MVLVESRSGATGVGARRIGTHELYRSFVLLSCNAEEFKDWAVMWRVRAFGSAAA